MAKMDWSKSNLGSRVAHQGYEIAELENRKPPSKRRRGKHIKTKNPDPAPVSVKKIKKLVNGRPSGKKRDVANVAYGLHGIEVVRR